MPELRYDALAISDGPTVGLTRSEAPQQTIVVGVCADPVPDRQISVEDGEGAIAEANAGRIDRTGRMDLFEPQAGMLRIVEEEPVCRARAAPYVFGQLSVRASEALGRPRRQRASGSRALVRPARCSVSASSARRARASWD